MFQRLTVVFFLLSLVSCDKWGSNEPDKIRLSRWLLGEWENKSSDGKLNESWKKVNDSTFNATSYFIKGKDTVHFESIELQQKGEFLNYAATVKGQNGDKPIIFKLTNSTENQLVFENPKHDYPQKIIYTQLNETNMTAEITGILSGKPAKEKFQMKKISAK